MPAELDNLDPEMDQSAEMDPNAELDAEPAVSEPTGDVIGTHGDADREGAMAKADLFKLANYSHKLYQKLQDDDQLEAWVQAKITKAADYVASVYHYLEYEMKFSEYGHHLDNSDTLSEGQKMKIKELLAEAKGKMKDLKKSQAEKVKAKKVEEGILSGGEQPCAECGGTGTVHMAPATIPDHVKSKVEKYNKQAKAFHAASKRLDKNHNGIPDDEEVDEGFGDAEPKEMKTGDKKKTRTGELTKTSTGVIHKNTSYHDDGDEIASNAKSGKGIKSHAKAQSAAEKKEKAPAQKQSPKSAKTWGMKDGSKFDNRDKEVDESIVGQGVYEAKGKKPDFLDFDKDGDKKEPMKKAIKDKKVAEAAKPSAGLSAAKKSAVVKKAKAGGDIGKPGKSFDKVAKSAGGGEKGKKIAAAAMWKNIKETQIYIAEKAKAVKDLPGKQEKIDADHDGKIEASDLAKLRAKKETVKESSDFSRLQELTGRLNRSEKPALVENREVDQIRALTKRLLG
jgi:hypothetical protein